ncbi:50S ribosomal protein L21e [Nanohaloarchaea archaeon]|nr:50S ribosomal protein L21e [Nanohaloarchaea archaeon H12]NMI88956.1 50S ribosomal protein L21e [Candidatus Nanohaloarchaea archaeon]
MAQKSQGSQQGARKKLKKDSREKTTVNDRLQSFEEGDKALIHVDSSVQEGRPHMRFHGKTAEVTGQRGDAYIVEFDEGDETKTLQIDPAHLNEVNQ